MLVKNHVKVGMIGLGKMGTLHMKSCLLIDGVDVAAAADFSRKTLLEAKSSGVHHVYTDYKDMLKNETDLDAVIISLPNYLHFESVGFALERGLDVFVEKPLARNSKECQEIVGLVERSDRRLMVGHSMRFVDAVQQVKERADKGEIGGLEAINLEEVMNGPFSHGIVPSPVPDWWFDPEKSGGGVVLDIGYHLIDLFRFFAGESKVLFSSLDNKFNLPVEDSAILVLQSLESSIKGIINVGWYQQLIFPNFNFRMIVHGRAGYLSTDDFIPRNMYLHAAKEAAKNFMRKIVGKKIRPLSYTYYYESHHKELKHFFDCLIHDLEPEVSALDGLKTLELVEEAYKQSASD